MRTRLALAALAVAGLLAAGCSSASTPHAPGGSGGGTAANANPDAKALWISCLGNHGVPITNRGVMLSDNSPVLRRATQACRSLEPRPGGNPPITPREQADYLRAAQCMRTHGVPQFPDPVFAHGGVSFPIPAGLNTHTIVIQRAVATCRRLIPRGLPYSGG